MDTLFRFLGGDAGPWRVTRLEAPSGAPLPAVARIAIVNAALTDPAPDAGWVLQAFTSNLRYATGAEVSALQDRQQGLGRAGATCAALIPIRKSAAWWALPQDRRRAIFEETSHHNAIGMEYLPAVARRLHHCRDLGEPFDFLTWFEYAAEDAGAFDTLLRRLRATEEWRFVEREVDVRKERCG